MKKLSTILLSISLLVASAQVKLRIQPSMILDEKAYTKSNPFFMFDENALTGSSEPPVGNPINRWGEYLDAQLYYPLAAVIDLGQNINISNIYFYDGSGGGKVEVYSGNLGSWSLLFTDNFGAYNSWVKHPVNKSTRYLRILNYDAGNNFLEMVIYGDKQAIAPPKPIPTINYPTIDNFMGVNIIHATSNPADAAVVKHLREFHEWSWDEANEQFLNYQGYPQNQYGFNPSWAGNWNFDKVYKSYKDNGNTVYPTLQSSSYWLLGGILNDSTQNKPIKPWENAEDPASYVEHADYMYQFAARYGKSAVPTVNIKTKTDNQKLSALNYVDGIENWNEPNKNWKGRRGLFLPFEYAAMTSADYDGHEKRLGTTVGAKNADPNIKFIMAGLISLDTAYIKAMKYWFESARTDKKFVPDVINFHNYCNDGSGQGNPATKGVSPEQFNLEAKTKAVVDYCKRNLPDKQVWVTEFGYDVQQAISDQKAPPYASFSAEQVQAMWNVRNYLAYAAAGVDRAYLYWLSDSNSDEPFKFESCGLIKNTPTLRTRRPAWYWTYTMRNVLKNYKFKSKPVSGNDNVMIQEYAHSTNADSVVYVLWCPTSNGTTVNTYNLNLPSPGASSAVKITATNGNIKGTSSKLTISNSTVVVKVTEDPTYVVVKKATNALIDITDVSDNLSSNTVLIYPNPVKDDLTINAPEDIESIEIIDVKGVMVLEKTNIDAKTFTLDVSHLDQGIYALEIVEHNGKVIKSKVSIVK